MAIRLTKAQSIQGLDTPAGAVVFGLTPDAEGALAQGGDAVKLPASPTLAALNTTSTGQQAIVGADGSSQAIDGVRSGIDPHYLFCIPAQQFAGAGDAADISGRGADARIKSAYTAAAAWANDGYCTTGAGANLNLSVPLALSGVDFSQQSVIFSMLINKATPAGTEYLCGNSGGANQGWYASVNNAGKVQIIIVDSVGTVGMTAVSTAVFCDGTDHVMGLAIDHRTRKLLLYRDGALCDVKTLAFTGTITSAQAFAFGSYNGSNPTTYAAKFSGVHYLAYAEGLPWNTNQIMRRLARRPHMELRSSETLVYSARTMLVATVGQSNLRGNGVQKDVNGAMGAPLRDPIGPQGAARSCWPRFAQLMAAKGIWADVHNAAVGGTSAPHSWTGVIKAWANNLVVARGTYVLSSGCNWRTSLGVLPTNPANGPGLQVDNTHMNDDALNNAALALLQTLIDRGVVPA